MPNSEQSSGIVSNRLNAEDYKNNFNDLHAPLDAHEAAVAADRCYFCYDAPCVTACPTSIDIPLFVRQISTGTPEAAANTIFEQNILGGMCARVCPTETLCEEVCVRETAEGEPILIGQLQRYATDIVMANGTHPFTRAPETGKKIAVVGAGPAGLACAHRLALKGHNITVFDARTKGGGLNEYGIAAYKSVNGFAQSEVDWLLQIGGIDVQYGSAPDISVLKAGYDAVFLGFGLGGVNTLGIDGSDGGIVEDAVDFIATLRQTSDLSTLPIGRNIVVIGGGMTAVDAAVQSKLLGAENVTMVYRRGKDRMSASGFEQDLATSKGVRIIYHAQPVRVSSEGVEFGYTRDVDGKLQATGENFVLRADQVFTAIGQKLDMAPEGLTLESGKIKVDENGQTSDPAIWAGGDCATGGDDLTVTAVAEGRDAAEAIHQKLLGDK